MTTFVAWGNIQQSYPFETIPLQLLNEKLTHLASNYTPVRQRYHCRRLAHFLLWQLLQKAGVNTALLGDIKRSSSNRPYFLQNHIDFNISHSDDWVAVVLQVDENNDKSAVGIDIEFVKKTRNYTALLQHFARRQEVIWFQQKPCEARFYQIWCGREALLKSQGVGIVKLSEVKHEPEKLLLHSDYCPTGKLIFTAELPFYFALFCHQHIEQTQYFMWQDNRFVSKKLTQAIEYQVNPLKQFIQI
ncbi:4'-phosphopantetheinyl transferase family protein [Histophilus somni]|uniref:4'-phosphopantetheinyl transferase superfamily protein n=1 Tax=Histophilus somni TaxID=731 RepID=A0AAX2S4E9_HISSO|nr:4'-phosphopantetheinyl transferase superfamily protein [Histophilus somni]QEH08412.1 4'-phosphopantetheinyl transferase superfamily protein [Histophilus somni]QEH13008.1 4'-phosphopantetheinyl transferase superfamily protein [Histophilus somni]QEH24681.1 4'-phosphopantetheinyl transferase superfamily protein [Histophilus somni]QEH27493.1 4'-phosphopantetheinyl transferase superfamily protein [Histophilus somni]QQF65358.1 4'-phosphopantetheinyl transferase superfamily protein [Histophilus so